VPLDTEIEEAWKTRCDSLIPATFKADDEKTYHTFKECLNEKKASINLKILLAHFIQKSGEYWN
jgi:hypothetical protein